MKEYNPKLFNGRNPCQRANYDSDEIWEKASVDYANNYFETSKKLQKELFSVNYKIRSYNIWMDLFLKTGDFKDEELINKIKKGLNKYGL